MLVVAVALTVWSNFRIADQASHVVRELTKPRSAYQLLGADARARVLELNSVLLRARLTREAAEERLRFQVQAQALEQRLRKSGPPPEGRDGLPARLVELERACQTYLTEAAALLTGSPPTLRRQTVEASQEEIARISEPVLRACDTFQTEASAAEAEALDRARARLAKLRPRRAFSVALLVLGGVGAAGLAYLLVFHAPGLVHPASPQLERQEKLASLGTLAAGVAHEIRNPLTAIKLRLFSLKRSLPSAWTDHEDLQVIANEISRLERIVTGLLEFARPAPPAMGEVSAVRLFAEVRTLLQPELDQRGVRIVLDVTTPRTIRADRTQMQQVLINLIQNAADSIRGRGTITLRGAEGVSRLAGQSRTTVVLEVNDTGQGIPVEAQKRLFDPFFSTKEGGTGLGLAIAVRIVENHGGLIQYQTQLNRGTTFQVVLPGSDAHAGDDPPH
jgi:signal transduction histidine kinase